MHAPTTALEVVTPRRPAGEVPGEPALPAPSDRSRALPRRPRVQHRAARLSAARPPRPSDSIPSIVAGSVLADGEQTVFPVGPAPFADRAGMRARINIVGPRAATSEMP